MKHTLKQKLRKGLAALVLAIFILSVAPMALAESKQEDNIESIDGIEKGIDNDGLKEAKEAKGFKVNRKESAGNFLKAKIAAEKEFTKEQIEQMRERMKNVKEKYEQARELYKEQKDDLKELRDRYRACKDSSKEEGSEECVKVRKDVSGGVKKHLEKTIELIENSLARLTTHVKDSTVLTDEEKQSALNSINKLQEKVTAEKDRVLSLVDTASAEELRNEVKELKKLWQEVSKQQKRIISMLTSAKLENLVEKHNTLVESIQKKIDVLKSDGTETSELEAIFADFKAAAAKLAEDQQKARAFWQQAEDMSKENLQAWHDAQKVVKEDLQETRGLLRKFMEEYREAVKLTKAEKEAEKVNEAPTAEE